MVTGQAMASSTHQPVGRPVQVMTWIVFVLVLLIGIPLFLLSDRTASTFAWTINPPLQAAFLGAGYWGVAISTIFALQIDDWRSIRGAGLVAMVMTTVVLGVTLIHLDRFHFNEPDLLLRLGAWAWLIVYAVVPPTLVLVYAWQVRMLRRSSSADGHRRPGAVLPVTLRATLSVYATLTAVAAALLLLSPGSLPWPWSLTPLTSRMTGAFIGTLAATALVIGLENDVEWSLLPGSAMVSFAVLELLALVRFAGDVRDTGSSLWLYVAMLLVAAVLGAWTLIARSRWRQAQVQLVGAR